MSLYFNSIMSRKCSQVRKTNKVIFIFIDKIYTICTFKLNQGLTKGFVRQRRPNKIQDKDVLTC